MLHAQQLRFAYPNGDCALGVENFQVAAGEIVGIAGPSGAGKTTLLRLLAGLLLPREGGVNVNGKALSLLGESSRRVLRLRHFGLVFQSFELLDYLTLEENVLLPARLGAALDDALLQRAHDLIRALELEHRTHHRTSKLSQGERQRVAVARALVHQPQVVLADEPTSSLDGKRKHLVLDALARHAKEHGAALVIVSHDEELFGRADRVVNVEEWKR